MVAIKCVKCEQDKEEEEFNATEKKKRSGARCRPCMNEYKNIPEDQKKPRELDITPTDVTSKDWQGGKYKGTIIEKPDVFFARIGGIQKSFNFKGKEDQKEEIKNDAIKWKNEKCDEFGLTTNKYKLIFDINKQPQYIVVQLSKNYVTLVDYDMLDFVKGNNLCVTKSSRETSRQYAMYVNKESKNRPVHGYISGAEMTDHINGYPMDNRKINLQATNHSENNKNRTKIHKVLCVEVDGRYEGTIIYNDHTQQFRKIMIREYFDEETSCKSWIRYKTRELDNNKEDKNILRENFENIMKEHCDGFVWENVDIKENDDDIMNNINELVSHDSVQNDKKNIYDKFKAIDHDWSVPDDLLKSLKIEHIHHDGIEYKFCRSCYSWKSVDSFYKSKEKHDGLDNRCKAC